MKLVKEVDACDICHKEVKKPLHCYFCKKIGHERCMPYRLVCKAQGREGSFYPFCNDCWGKVLIVQKGTVIQ